MRKREKLLLTGTVGLGLLLAATYLPGKGRGARAPVELTVQPPAGEAATDAAPPATIELLATRRVELKPLTPGIRNPFRPVQAEAQTATTRVAVAIKVTGFFGEGDQLAALVKGEIVQPGQKTEGMTIVHVTVRERVLGALLRDQLAFPTLEEARLLALRRGKLVRTGDVVGGFTVVSLSPGHVDLERNGKQYRLKFPKRAPEPGETEQQSSATEPRRTESANY